MLSRGLKHKGGLFEMLVFCRLRLGEIRPGAVTQRPWGLDRPPTPPGVEAGPVYYPAQLLIIASGEDPPRRFPDKSELLNLSC